MDEKPTNPESLGELLGDWRAAGRDVKAAEALASVAEQALAAARAAEDAATETDAAAKAASESVDRSLAASQSARRAANHAAEAARIMLATAEGDKVRADIEVDRAAEREAESAQHFHDAQDKKFEKDQD